MDLGSSSRLRANRWVEPIPPMFLPVLNRRRLQSSMALRYRGTDADDHKGGHAIHDAHFLPEKMRWSMVERLFFNFSLEHVQNSR